MLLFRRWTAFAGLCFCHCSAAEVPGEAMHEPVEPERGQLTLEFDGEDDYASLGTARFPFPRDMHSISVWLNPTDTTGAQTVLVMRKGFESGTQLGIRDGIVTVWAIRDHASPETRTIYVESSSPLSSGVWQHVAYVYNWTDHRLYVDGQLAGVNARQPGNRTPTTAFIGSIDGFSEFYHGSLDELKIFDPALTPEEVVLDMSDPSALSTSSLEAHLRFDELSGGRAYDDSGNENHASLGDGLLSAKPTRVMGGPFVP